MMHAFNPEHMTNRARRIGEIFADLAMITPDYRAGLERFRTCLERRDNEPPEDGVSYCKLLICEPCQYNRFASEHAFLMARVLAGLEANPKAQVISLTIGSPMYGLPSTGDVLNRMLGAWTRFSERKTFQTIAGGFARTVRLRLDPLSDAVRCETNILVLTERNHTLQTAEEWLHRWHLIPRCDLDTINHFRVLRGQDDGFLADLHAEIEAITWIGVDPIELCEFVEASPSCSRAILDHIFRALRGRKLIRTGRSFMQSEQREW